MMSQIRTSRDPSPAPERLRCFLLGPSPTRGEGALPPDFPTLMQDSASPLPLWERRADTGDGICSDPGEGEHGACNAQLYAANSFSPMNSPGAMPPGQAKSPPPVWVENWLSMSNFASLEKILTKPS